MEILVLLGLILLNGLFAMSEIAIVTAKKSRLEAMSERGSRSAQTALELAEDPARFLSTVQIGITSIGIMNGIFGESILAEPFSLWLQTIGVPVDISDNGATILVVVVVTYLSIVVGELVPKRIGQVNAERIACMMAIPIHALAIITKPFVLFLSGSTRILMQVLGFNQIHDKNVTEEDIHAMLDEGSISGVLEKKEHAMVKNVLRLEERNILSLMVPRSDIVYLDTSLSMEENYQRVMQSPHSRFPICDKSIDNIIGVINAKELLSEAISRKSLDLKLMAKPCPVVPESISAMELLEFFHDSHNQMALIVDEYGTIKGIVTLHDLLEALTGEFSANDDEDAYIIRRDDGSFLLDGMLSIFDLKDCLELDDLPDEEDYKTLNGLIMSVMGEIPTAGEKITLLPWQLEIVDMDGQRVDKVLATRIVDS